MNTEPQLHSSIVALVSLASGIAAKHPAMGMCQLDKLRDMGIPESQIQTVIEIARHIRDESSQLLDQAFNEKAKFAEQTTDTQACCGTDETTTDSGGCCSSDEVNTADKEESCCSSTPSGQSCC